MQHTTVAIDSIEPHPLNVRQGDIGLITNSLKEHGQYRPIVVQTSTNRILAGNHTYKAAKALKWKQIEATFIDCDDDQALRILLMDNRANDVASYDDHALVSMLKEMMETELKLDGTGFDPSDLDDLIRDLELADDKPNLSDPDAVPNDAPSKTVSGDVWLLGKHRLVCADSTNPTDLAKLMNGKQADMVFTDPPYGMNLDTDYTKMGSNKKYSNVIGDNQQFDASFLLTTFSYCKEIFLWGADYYVETLNRQYPDLGSWIIWDKYSDERIGLLDGRFGSTFETCWSKTTHKREIARVLVTTNYTAKGDETRVHPTQKPVALAKWFFERWGKEQDIVVDLFGGSGSTLIAAHETNRVGYLMELDPKYCDVICKRWEQLTGITPVAEATGNPHTFL